MAVGSTLTGLDGPFAENVAQTFDSVRLPRRAEREMKATDSALSCQIGVRSL